MIYTPKPTNIAELKKDLPQGSLIRQSCHFERDFHQLAEFEHSVQIPRGFITDTFELLTKKLRKSRFVITEYSRRDCMSTWI